MGNIEEMTLDIQLINGKWTLFLGEIKITGNSKEALENLFKSFTEDAD